MIVPSSSEQIAAKCVRNVRYYDTNEGKRLNVSAIVTDRGVNFNTFHDRQHRGSWPNIPGGRLPPVRMGYAPGRYEATYLAANVDKALEPPVAMNGRFQVQGEWRLTFERVMQRLGLSRRCLSQLVRYWPWEGDRFIFRWDKEPGTATRARTGAESTIDVVEGKLKDIRDGRIIDPEGRPRLSLHRSINELCTKSGEEGKRERRSLLHYLVYYFRKVACPPLGDDLLDAEKYRFPGVCDAELWFLEEHIFDIKLARKAKALRRKTASVIRNPKRPPRKKSPVEMFNGVFHEPDGSQRFTIAEAGRRAQKYGLSKAKLWLHSKDGFPEELGLGKEFPDGFPGGMRLIPGGNTRVETIADSDLERLGVAYMAAVDGPRLPGGAKRWKTIKEILRQHEFRGDHAKADAELRRLHAAGELPGRRCVRRTKGKRGWSMALLLDTKALDKLLAGKSLTEFLRERYQAKATSSMSSQEDVQTNSTENGRNGTQASTANGQSPGAESGEPTAEGQAPTRRCGRQLGWRKIAAQQRDCRFKEAWRTGKFKSASALGLQPEFDLDPSYARRLAREAEAGK